RLPPDIASQVFDQAIAGYEKVIEINPTAEAYTGLGVAYAGKKDLDRALKAYDQAIRLDPNYSAAYGSRGFAYNDKKDYDRAIADLDQAIRLDPADAISYNNRGNSYFFKKDYDRAIADYS